MGFSIILAFAFLIFYYCANQGLNSTLKTVDLSENKRNAWTGLAFILVCSAILQFLLAYYMDGYPNDMSCWKGWGARVVQNGISNFYGEGYFCDYPPGYIYILGFLSSLSDKFNLSDNGINLLFKLPSIIANLGITAFIYSLAKKQASSKFAILISLVFALNPLYLWNGPVWGQIESILALALIISLYLVYKEKYVWGAVLYVIAVLLKPQALLIAPLYLFIYLEMSIKNKNWKTLVYSVLGGLAVFFLLTVPFSPAWAEGKGFFGALNPMWVIDKYFTTLDSYSYFTVNAYNIFALFGKNWAELPQSLNAVNYLIVGAAVIISFIMFIKIKSRSGKIFLTSFFIMAFLFTFAFKMHERYLVPALVFLLIEFVISKNKRILHIFAGFSAISFLNVFYVLYMVLVKNNAMPADIVVRPIAFLEILMFIYAMWVIIKDYIISSDKVSEPLTGNIFVGLKNKLDFAQNKIKAPHTEKMVRIDYMILAAIVLVYSVIAFINLGTTNSPQTYAKPASTGEEFICEFESPEQISAILYYQGIGDVANKVGYQMSYSNDGVNWNSLNTELPLNSVFKWERLNYDTPFTAKYIKGISNTDNCTLYELGFRDSEGQLIRVTRVGGDNPQEYQKVFDEQQTVPEYSSYKNGTYFDEIYHPRTAFEHLHMLPYYETTHPPLGKLFISVGVAVFGMSPFGWRVSGTLFGIFMLPLLYLFLKKMFGRTRYAVIGTLLFAFDFMHFSLTRMGTIDSYPVFFIIAMYYFMYDFGKKALRQIKEAKEAKNKKFTLPVKPLIVPLLLSGIAFGMGAASKWIAIYSGAGLAVELAFIMTVIFRELPKERRKLFGAFLLKVCSWCILFFILIPGAIYLCAYIPIAMTGKYGSLWNAMYSNQKYMFGYHSKLSSTHPYSSKWYQWPLVYRPLWAYSGRAAGLADGNISCISIFGNPFLWWTGIISMIYSIIVGIKKRSKTILFLVIAIAAQYVPWMFVSRTVFIYHFFASTPFLIMFIIYAMKDLEERFSWFKNASNMFVVICLLMFVAFYPVLSGMEVSKIYVDTFLRWFKTWVFFS